MTAIGRRAGAPTQMKQHKKLPLNTISRDEGVWLYGSYGKRYLDAIGSSWVNLFGHANKRIDAALRHQLDHLELSLGIPIIPSPHIFNEQATDWW